MQWSDEPDAGLAILMRLALWLRSLERAQIGVSSRPRVAYADDVDGEVRRSLADAAMVAFEIGSTTMTSKSWTQPASRSPAPAASDSPVHSDAGRPSESDAAQLRPTPPHQIHWSRTVTLARSAAPLSPTTGGNPWPYRRRFDPLVRRLMDEVGVHRRQGLGRFRNLERELLDPPR
jgi:hypothetical protein